VRANADTGEDARKARELGAEGIGLCRTEHMFFGADREELVRDMFVAGALARHEGESSGALAEFEASLARLEELQRADFTEILAAMSGHPVTIRLLDPPLHEFIPVTGFERELESARASDDGAAIPRAETRLEVARELEETNPMLGTRGARLGLTLPGLYEMQSRAIARAAVDGAAKGEPVQVEIMLPLVAFSSELETLRQAVEATVKGVLEEAGADLRIAIGTMIELPRACLVANEIAQHAEFFSFGTNDLTQTALGLSRDDAERGFLPEYLSRGILASNPFESIDRAGVGALVEIAVERGRQADPGLHLGVCGEHGGDPASIEFFHRAGLDYVSCSPYRVPVARVAAAQAALG
jgi:pyruvate,orthophosphate dikinase